PDVTRTRTRADVAPFLNRHRPDSCEHLVAVERTELLLAILVGDEIPTALAGVEFHTDLERGVGGVDSSASRGTHNELILRGSLDRSARRLITDGNRTRPTCRRC